MKNKNSRTIVLTFFLLSLLFSSPSWAEKKILFEGYYKISLFSKHVGFFVQRYELDTTKKEFHSTYFLRTNEAGGNISESLKAAAKSDLTPLNYQYTALLGTKAKTIDANVLDNVLHMRISENGKMSPKQVKMAKGTFFSTFLAYMLLQGPKGISPGVKYSYKAIAEEDGKVLPGDAFIEKEEKIQGQSAYKILNTFKSTQFVNFVSGAGDSIRSLSPSSGLDAQLVTNPLDATKGMPSADSTLKNIFGNIPAGLTHPLAKAKSSPAPQDKPKGK